MFEVLSLHWIRLTTLQSSYFREAKIRSHGGHWKEALQLHGEWETFPTKSQLLMGTTSKVTARYFTTEPFNRAHPEFLETREDNNNDCCFKLELFLSGIGVIYFTAIVTRIWAHWLRMRCLNGVGMEMGGGGEEGDSHFCLLYFHHIPSGLFRLHIQLPGIFSFIPPLWLPSTRKACPPLTGNLFCKTKGTIAL